jgi:hypothetical protein
MLVLTVLVCVVAVASREPLRGATGSPTGTREGAEDVVVAAPTADFPVPGALPPEVFVIDPDESRGTPEWLPWMLAGIGLTGLFAGGLFLVSELRLRSGKRGRRGRARRGPRRSQAAEPSPAIGEDEAEQAQRAVEAAMEPLRDPADTRGAVIAAYAQMETTLAEQQLGRRPPEAPREYLTRVLRKQGVPEGSLTTLTALFEEARFSLHPIPRSAPNRALAELENARAALRAADVSHS